MPNADFTPSFNPSDIDTNYGSTGGDITVPTFHELKPFRFWCQKALPLVYDDSLSYYELLCKVVDYLNNMMTDLTTATGSISEFAQQFVTNQQFLNDMAEALGDNTEALQTYINERMEDFTTAYEELQDYVNNYFTNLDVQNEINTKLNVMAQDGTLSMLLEPFTEDWLEEKTAQITEDLANQNATLATQNQTIATQNSRLSVLEGRMDTFASLPSGSTSGNAELLDIRTNFLGETFGSAGDAVRVSDLLASGFSSQPIIFEWIGDTLGFGYFDTTRYKGGKIAFIVNTAYEGITEYGRLYIGNATSEIDTIRLYSDSDTDPEHAHVSDYLDEYQEKILTSDSEANRILVTFSIPSTSPYLYIGTSVSRGTVTAGLPQPNFIVYASNWLETPIDPTLTQSGEAADAKATGDAISSLNESLEGVESTIDITTEEPGNLVDMSNVTIGKNWLNQDAVGRAVLYINVTPNTLYYIVIPQNNNLMNVDAVEKPSMESGQALKSTNLVTQQNPTANTTLTTHDGTNVICLQFSKGSIAITDDDFIGYDPYVGRTEKRTTAVDIIARDSSLPWKGKSFVWLGTSIPAAGKYNMPVSYPLMVGDILGAIVHNEAVGSSALHCKDPNRISTSNPYGFMNNFEAVSRCITNSLAEMNWIIEHYNDSAVFTQNVPATLTDADKEFIRSCSWENKLNKYFNENDFPDVWVIDHGHNDIPSVASEATYSEKETITGTNHNGYYSGGTFVNSTASSYIEYDVSDELYVWISGTFGSWYDVYDIFDSDNNNIGYTRYATETGVTNLRVDVSRATTLRVSNINTLMSTVQVKKLKYPMYNSLYSFQGGFDFIVNKILTYNPRARIVMIGEYENQKYPTISENQLIASERWEFPIYKQWENLGWSQMPILSNGQYMSMLNIIIPDNLHPHTDQSGFALRTMAQNISAWLMTIR